MKLLHSLLHGTDDFIALIVGKLAQQNIHPCLRKFCNQRDTLEVDAGVLAVSFNAPKIFLDRAANNIDAGDSARMREAFNLLLDG
ncbi:hypothetical protein A8B75_12300 [Sphingomonadales bacterium EhC05]|nr:hypothetical protein A8B75_12300 [Sphingomonadales bacterium EhC05]